MISYQWRGDFASAEVDALHADGFGRAPADHDWKAQVHRHSLGWVCARRGAELAGFVNVAWDGGVHAFILDTVVAGPLRRHGIGTRLVEVAAREADAAGCEWLHVDFEDHLGPIYFGCCGFRPRTPASSGWAQTAHQSGEAHPAFRRPSRPATQFQLSERALPPFGADIDCISIKTLAAQIRVVCAPRCGSGKRSLATGAARCAQAIREYRKAPMCGHPGVGIWAGLPLACRMASDEIRLLQ